MEYSQSFCKANNKKYFYKISKNLIGMIFEYFDLKDLIILAYVNKKFKNIVNYTDLLKIVLHKNKKLEEFEVKKKLKGHKDSVTSIIKLNWENEDTFATSSCDNTIRLWNFANGKCNKVLTGHENFITCLIQIENIPEIYSNTSNKDDNFERDEEFYDREYLRSSISYDEINYFNNKEINNSINANLNKEKTNLYLNKYLDSKYYKNLKTKIKTYDFFDFENKYMLASGSCDKTIKVWNAVSGICIFTLKGHEDSISSLMQINQYRSNSKVLIISSGQDKKVKIWDLENKNCCFDIKFQDDTINSIIQLSKNSYLNYYMYNNTINYDNIDNKNDSTKEILDYNKNKKNTDNLNNFLVEKYSKNFDDYGIPDFYFFKFDLSNKKDYKNKKINFNVDMKNNLPTNNSTKVEKAEEIKSSNIDNYVVAFKENKNNFSNLIDNINNYKNNSIKNTLSIDSSNQIINNLKQFQKNNYLVFSGNNSLKIWNLEEEKEILNLQLFERPIRCILQLTNHHKSEPILATAGLDNDIKIIDLQKKKIIFNLKGHKNFVHCLSEIKWSNSIFTLISGGFDKAIKFWDTLTGQCIKTIIAHTNTVNSLIPMFTKRDYNKDDKEEKDKKENIFNNLYLLSANKNMIMVFN